MTVKYIKLYSTPTCPWCAKAKEFLDINKITYQDFNVAENKVARKDLINTTHQLAVPVLNIDGEYIIGFNEKSLKQKLGIS
jgi:glutaredoxin 3